MKRTATAVQPEPDVRESSDALIDRAESLGAQLTAIQRELESLSFDRDRLRPVILETRNELAGWQARLENDREDGKPKPWVQEKVADAQQRLDAATRRAEEVDRRMAQLRADAQRIESEDLPACRTGISLAVVQDHQKDIDAATGALAEIERVIAEHEAVVKETALVNLAAFQTQIEDLRAAHATGQMTAGELAEREAAIVAKREDAAAANRSAQARIADAHLMIGGMVRRREEARHRLDSLKRRLQWVIASFVEVEREQAGAEFTAAAIRARDAFARVVALSRIAQRFGAKTNVLFDTWPTAFRLPALRLAAGPAAGGASHVSGIWFDAAAGGALWDKATQDELARMRDKGVTL